MRLDAEQIDRRLAYSLLRLTMGLNICLHGAVRLPTLSTFADGLVKSFAATPLPALVVRPFG